jgi:hypothetical protein
MMTESVGEGRREGSGGPGQNARLKIVAVGVVVVRGGEDRVVCKEVQVGEGFRAGCGGDVRLSFSAGKRCGCGSSAYPTYLVIRYVPDTDQAWARHVSESQGSWTRRPAQLHPRLQRRLRGEAQIYHGPGSE